MLIQMDETLESILNLIPMVTDIFFKHFQFSSGLLNDLNKTHTRTLMILKFEGPSTMSVISHKVELEKGSFTPVANKLIQLGYIEKLQSSGDKRKSMLQLTEVGHTVAEKFHEEHTAYMHKQLNKLTEAERDVYLAAINLVLCTSRKMLEE
ncbi:MarR family winged helix-turn-helix transcriptional regulator [Vallitalea okinawensis]|uniref:MarR family winged helix-turn-helix transcriptional regulator n=1 Tax=Vallitalea okinawensis TaxID=2078660 RepID=UPI000CFC80C0|nr:MarR family transcriptional regulator [Vallitalea okinawensis]